MIIKELLEEIDRNQKWLCDAGYTAYNIDIAFASIYRKVKALEQEPSEDCISRNELLSRIDAERKHLLDIKMDGAEHIVVHHARRIIEDMPSVTPQQTRWIPVSERLPEEYADVICCTDAKEVFIASYLGKLGDESECFDDDNGMMYEGDVTAWMPLPEPYKAENKTEQGLDYADQDTLMSAT